MTPNIFTEILKELFTHGHHTVKKDIVKYVVSTPLSLGFEWIIRENESDKISMGSGWYVAYFLLKANKTGVCKS